MMLTRLFYKTKTPGRDRFYLRLWVKIGLGMTAFLLLHIGLVTLFVVQFNVVSLFFSFVPKERVSGLNILAFGIDNTRSIKRSDTVIVLHLDDQNTRIGALSIPRDTRVLVDGVGNTRINHAYAHGGEPLLRKTVSEFLGIPIHYSIKVDLSGVEALVDILGGVEVDVKKDLVYSDQAGDLYIDLKQGEQVLDGKKAVQYLRFRQDDEGDIGRIRRQQLFLSQLSKKVMSLSALAQFPKLVKQVSYVVSTDLSFLDMISLSMQFKDAIRLNRIEKETVPGTIALVGGAYYWKPNITDLDAIVEKTLLGARSITPESRMLVEPLDFDSPDTSLAVHTEELLPPDTLLVTEELEEVVVESKPAMTGRQITISEVKRVAQVLDLETEDIQGMTVEILNGVGKGGLAKRFAKLLKEKGLLVPRFDNAGHFGYTETKLVDWKGNIDSALAIAVALHIDPKNIVVYDKPHKPLDFTLVIGQDWDRILMN